MSPEKLDAVTIELKRFAQELNLSDLQKEQLKAQLADKHAKLQEFRQQNPNISKNDLVKKIVSVRGTLREQVVRFLTPQQLEKWDAEVSKAKEFLGHSIAA
jgi:protein CpxP